MAVPGEETLLSVLARRAREEPCEAAFLFGGEAHSYEWLWHSAGRFASLLRSRALGHGDRVVIALPNGTEFFAAFYGCQRLGSVAVPIFAGSGSERLTSMVRLCGARAVILPAARSDLDSVARALRSSEPDLEVLTVGDGDGMDSGDSFPEVGPDDVAYLQYTSGSTADPKGVQISQANILANIDHLVAGMRITEKEVFVSWLPVYHDMGLVLMTMVPFFLGAKLVLLPASLKNIHDWLGAIAEHRGTFTAAPDFAYRLCIRYAKPERCELSSLRVALNAAEPVRASTVSCFEELFGLANVIMPGYGLAEATVGVSMMVPGSTVRVDARGFISVGPPFPGVEVIILGDGGRASPGEEGEILVRSDATTSGYYRNPQATAALFWEEDFIRTGDLGYLDEDGYLYIVGRMKNIIIRAGRNLAPQEIEEIVDSLPFVRLSAAVGVDRGGAEGEQVYAFAEVRESQPRDAADYAEMARQIVEDVHRELGLRPGRVYLTRPGTIPLTHNGKIRHAHLKQHYLSGELRSTGAVLFPDY